MRREGRQNMASWGCRMPQPEGTSDIFNKHFKAEVLKMSFSIPAKFQTCAKGKLWVEGLKRKKKKSGHQTKQLQTTHMYQYGSQTSTSGNKVKGSDYFR